MNMCLKIDGITVPTAELESKVSEAVLAAGYHFENITGISYSLNNERTVVHTVVDLMGDTLEFDFPVERVV